MNIATKWRNINPTAEFYYEKREEEERERVETNYVEQISIT